MMVSNKGNLKILYFFFNLNEILNVLFFLEKIKFVK